MRCLILRFFGVFDDLAQRDQVWTLEDILPASMKEVETFCEGLESTEDDRKLLSAGGTYGLEDVTIWNCTWGKWISRNSGDGEVQEA